MRSVDELLEQARRLPAEARRELRDRLDEFLEEDPAVRVDEGPYSSLLKSAGSAQSLFSDVSRQKNKHLADIYAGKRRDR
jgi:hypothetical protein